MYDVAIIGAGPAGLSAAITARMRDLSCVVLGAGNNAGWLAKAHRLDNYPGMPGVSGKKLLETFIEQATERGAVMMQGVVRQIMPMGQTFMLLCENELLEARSIILAMGAARPKPLPGEIENLGTGVSYCATCDGMFFKGKQVAALSSTEHGLTEAVFLASLAAKVDYYTLKAHEASSTNANLSLKDEKPVLIQRAEAGLELHLSNGDTEVYDGIFIFRPAVAMSTLLPSLKMDGAFVPVNRQMETNIPGVYACGDLTGHPLQVAKAVGEGNVAAISCSEYLAGNKK